MTSDLLPCPFCGGPASWCGDVPCEDGDTHHCDQIRCLACDFNFDCHSAASNEADTIEQSRAVTAAVWNRRPC